MFWGEDTRIGQFYPPAPLDYNSSIHVPNGNHSLFVLVTFWITPVEEYADRFKVQNVSQVVNFTVSAETPTPSPVPTITPTPTEEPQQPEQDMTAGAVLAVASIAVFLGLLVYFIKRK